ncbi:MAG TPA: TolC family protein, partial [Blastocatellia bacterium]|nr:TolC family protein [Blastocatellia bacterium]
MRRNNLLKMLLILTIAGGMALAANGQESGVRAGSGIVAPAAPARAPSSAGAVRLDSYSQFVDEVNGATPDDLIRYAFQHNGELAAARQMIAEAEGRLNQAGLKANPMVESNYQQGVTSADNNFTIGAELPLEPGRRAARVAVATSELELARAETADFERKLTAEVRARLAEVLAAARNLKFSEELLGLDQDSHRLVHALVELGKRAPLEESTLLVEVNRADAMRAANLGRAESALFELKKTIGMPRDEPLRLHDEFARDFQPARQADLVRDALLLRPDLQAARAAEKLAKARVEQARVEGRIDASIFANYQRMATSFDQRGFNSQGLLVPVAGIFHFASFGVRLALPVRNKNQGAVE